MQFSDLKPYTRHVPFVLLLIAVLTPLFLMPSASAAVYYYIPNTTTYANASLAMDSASHVEIYNQLAYPSSTGDKSKLVTGSGHYCTGYWYDNSKVQKSVGSNVPCLNWQNLIQAPDVNGGYWLAIKDTNNNTWYAAHHYNQGSAPPIIPDANFQYSPNSNSGYPPLTVFFTDDSTNSPTSWNWSVAGNDTIVTTRNLTYTFNESGEKTITHGAANAAGSAIQQKNYIVKSYSVPDANLSYSIIGGTAPYAPLTVRLTDSSTNSPTEYRTIIYDSSHSHIYTTNYSQTFDYTFSTGRYDFYHWVSNPAGSDDIWLINLTVIGDAPEPTPTPTVPFPNQTGVCLGSSISIGSAFTRSFDIVASLEYPDSNAVDFYYPAGTPNIRSGDTSLTGTYLYSENNLSGQLVYRSSYVVGDCYNPTPTVTGTRAQPTIPVPIHTYPTVIPTTKVPSANFTNVPTYATIATIPTGIFLDNRTNITAIKERLIDWNPLVTFYLDVVDALFYDLNYAILVFIGLLTLPISGITDLLSWTFGTYNNTVAGFSAVLSLISWIISKTITEMPMEVQSAYVVVFSLDLMAQAVKIFPARVR